MQIQLKSLRIYEGMIVLSDFYLVDRNRNAQIKDEFLEYLSGKSVTYKEGGKLIARCHTAKIGNPHRVGESIVCPLMYLYEGLQFRGIATKKSDLDDVSEIYFDLIDKSKLTSYFSTISGVMHISNTLNLGIPVSSYELHNKSYIGGQYENKDYDEGVSQKMKEVLRTPDLSHDTDQAKKWR